jgi:hypothetical protein
VLSCRPGTAVTIQSKAVLVFTTMSFPFAMLSRTTHFMCTVPAYLSLSGAIFSLLFFHVFSRRIIRSNILSNDHHQEPPRCLNSKGPSRQWIINEPPYNRHPFLEHGEQASCKFVVKGSSLGSYPTDEIRALAKWVDVTVRLLCVRLYSAHHYGR